MKLTNQEIYNSIDALMNLKKSVLPIKVAYKLSKNINVLTEKYKFIEEQRNEIIKKYGKEKDGNYLIEGNDNESVSNFVKDFNEILNIEEDVQIEKLSFDELENTELSCEDLDMIKFMIKG